MTTRSMTTMLWPLGFLLCAVFALAALLSLGDTPQVQYYSKPEPEAAEEAVEVVEEVTEKTIEKAMLDLAATLRKIDMARAAGQDISELQTKAAGGEKMNRQYHPYPSRGIEPAPQLQCQPRCPISGLLIAPGDGEHIAAMDPETLVTKSFFIHKVFYPTWNYRVDEWLEDQGLVRVQQSEVKDETC